MSPESIDNFLSQYIRSLKEETRKVKAGPRYGLDRLIHQLSLAEYFTPIRLPFFRQPGDHFPKPKKEAEHGVDMSFISKDRKELRVFVLKDEPLTYKNFIAQSFDKDLRLAACPDLDDPSLKEVRKVRVILAYNKDEDEEGVENFERLINGFPGRLRDGISLKFERWNLTVITNLATEKLLTPAVLPENFFRSFSYVCSQFGDFDSTHPQWRELLVPDWRDFLSQVLAPPVREVNIRLVSIALIVLRQHAKRDQQSQETPGSVVGWIDLVEWAMIALFRAVGNAPPKTSSKIALIVLDFWVNFYLRELLAFYEKNAKHLHAEHSLEIPGDASELAGSSYRSHWHLARLGLLAMALEELHTSTGNAFRPSLESSIHQVTEWLVGMLNACPSCYRPMLDIQHIEHFLVWRALVQVGRLSDVDSWISQLTQRLHFRYQGLCDLPGIDHRNSWELLMESLSQSDPNGQVPTGSSYFILMLMELSLILPAERADRHIQTIFGSLVELDEPAPSDFPDTRKTVDLQGWHQSKNWCGEVLEGPSSGGYGISVALDAASPAESLRKYMLGSMRPDFDRFDRVGLASGFVLASLRHQSPLPAFFWRQALALAEPSES